MKSMLDLHLQSRFRGLQHLAQHIQVLTGQVESDSGHCLHTSTLPSTAHPQYRSIESGIQARPLWLGHTPDDGDDDAEVTPSVIAKKRINKLERVARLHAEGKKVAASPG